VQFSSKDLLAIIPILRSIVEHPELFPYLYNQTSHPHSDVLHTFVTKESLLKHLVSATTTSSSDVQLLSLQLINTMLSNEEYFQRVIRVLDFCSARKTISLITTHRHHSELEQCLSAFQKYVITDYRKGIEKSVDLKVAAHRDAVSEIYSHIDSASISPDEILVYNPNC
jgi:PUL domain